MAGTATGIEILRAAAIPFGDGNAFLFSGHVLTPRGVSRSPGIVSHLEFRRFCRRHPCQDARDLHPYVRNLVLGSSVPNTVPTPRIEALFSAVSRPVPILPKPLETHNF